MQRTEPWPGPWRCPLCGGALVGQAGGSLRCGKNHCFDRAKEGYWHLLPVQGKHSKLPGDSKEMVAARRAFLQAGYYQAFGDALARLTLRQQGGEALHVLDAGCGEGWYDRTLLAAARSQNRPVELAGFDISKEAVRLAAKAEKEARYAVASSFHQPVADGWADVVWNIFSPMAREEFLRVLRPGGVVLYAVPGPRHLFGMKQALYRTPYENTEQEICYEGFVQIDRLRVEDVITVPADMLENLFAMTPYYWNTPADGAARLRQLPQLTTEICFDFLVLQKQA